MSSLIQSHAENLARKNAKLSPQDYEAGYLKHVEEMKAVIAPIEKLVQEFRKNGRGNTRECDILTGALKEYHGIAGTA